MKNSLIIKALIAGLFSAITIGVLTLLTYKTEFGIFLIASFGSTMVLLYGYPESPFAQPKNIFFGHLVTSLAGLFVLYFIPLPLNGSGFLNERILAAAAPNFSLSTLVSLIKFCLGHSILTSLGIS